MHAFVWLPCVVTVFTSNYPLVYATQGIDCKNLVHQLCGCLLSSIGLSLSQDGLDGCGLINPTEKEMGKALMKLAMGLSDTVGPFDMFQVHARVCVCWFVCQGSTCRTGILNLCIVDM